MKLALDDFGTGYSSLTYLKRFPIDIVKIDQGFVADLEGDPASHAIVYSVIELAHRLGMTVVAEGVETPEQHQQLLELGCDSCQGYYFARPDVGRRARHAAPEPDCGRDRAPSAAHGRRRRVALPLRRRSYPTG